MHSPSSCIPARYPDATPEELQAMDNVCIICREEMVTGAKRLPCNHIFHTRWGKGEAFGVAFGAESLGLIRLVGRGS